MTWPSGVTECQHYWPFIDTGDYTDLGSVGGWDLTPSGAGLSFSTDGLVFDGTNVKADVASCNDMSGGVYSILMEYTPASGPNWPDVFADGSGWRWEIWATSAGNGYAQFIWHGATYFNSTIADVAGVKSQVVIVSEGKSANQVTVYLNGSPTGTYTVSNIDAGTGNFQVGPFQIDGAYKGSVQRVGTLVGTAWSADDVADIYSPPALQIRPVDLYAGILAPNYGDGHGGVF